MRLDASAQTISRSERAAREGRDGHGRRKAQGQSRPVRPESRETRSERDPSSIRPTQFAGPIGVTLAGDTQTITLDLNDPKAAIRAQGKVKLDAKQTAFEGVKLTVGKGRVELSGALKKDANSSYD